MEVAKKETFAESALHLLNIAGTDPGPAATLTQYDPNPRRRSTRKKSTSPKTRKPRNTAPRLNTLKTTKPVDIKSHNTGIKTHKKEYIENSPEIGNNNSSAYTRRTPATQPRENNGTFKRLLTPEIFQDIMHELATKGMFIHDAVKPYGISPGAVYDMISKKPEAAELYAHARQRQADALFRRTIETAEQCDGSQESFNRSKLLIDTLKWACAKINPAKYSDKAQIAVTGADGGPVTMIAANAVTIAEVQRLRSILDNAIDAEVVDDTPTGDQALTEQAAEG